MKRKRRKFRNKKVSSALPLDLTLSPPVIGNPSTFSSKPWWSSDWWNLTSEGANNDIVSDFGAFGDLAVAAGSIRGNSHRLAGTRCEDSFSLATGETLTGDSFLIAVVGDGLGSAEHSAYGSRKATYQFAQQLSKGLSQISDLRCADVSPVASAVIRPIKRNIASWSDGEYLAPSALSEGASIGDFETTLSFVVIPAQGEKGTRSIIFGQIGDSPILLLSGGQWHHVRSTEEILSTEDDGAILDSVTDGLHGAHSLLVESRSVSDSDVLLVATDGVGNFILSGEETLAAGHHFAEEWRRPSSPSTFINGLHFNSRTADDDRTAVVCWFNRQQFTDQSEAARKPHL
jgi:serine/threonine protein phosphatase PrpC